MPQNLPFNLAVLISRAALGLYLLFAGWSKVQREFRGGLGTFYGSDSFQGRLPGWLPTFIAMPYAWFLPWVELFFGLMLAIGLFFRMTSIVVTLVLLSIVIAIAGAGELLNPNWTFHHSAVFLALALLLATTGAGRFSVDHLWRGRQG